MRLPVSGLQIDVRAPIGLEDVLLAEAPVCDWPLTLRVIALLARDAGGGAVDCGALSVTDADALLLVLRRTLGGDWLRADVVCPAPSCGERIEIGFSVTDYLAHGEPGPDAGVLSLGADGWFALEGTDVTFRLPCCQDVVELADRADAGAELVRRCVRPAGIAAPLLRRVEDAMEALAPSLSRELEAACPECGHGFLVDFDVQRYCAVELRRRALSVFEDVGAIAARFHWSEAEILALPRERRLRYAELARSAA